MALETLPFDAADYLKSPEAQSELLAEAFAGGDPAMIAASLGIVARARGMSQVARDAGVTREALYRSLSSDGDPKLSTILGVMKALNLSLRVDHSNL